MTQTQITQVNVTVNRPPAPSKLQQMVAFISQGGTNTTSGTSTLITQLSDLTSILANSITISAATWTGAHVTITTSTAHSFVPGEKVVITGMTPAAYNGVYAVDTAVDSTHFTYALTPNPGTATVLGVVSDSSVSELTAMFTTFFAQGSNTPAYVLELGHGTTAAGVTALSTYIADHPNAYYQYVVPRGWDAESTFVTLTANQASDTSKLYFIVTCTLSTYASFTAKSVYKIIEAPTIPATEFTAAFRAYWIASQNPSSTNQVPPASYSYAIGVTPYPVTNAQKTTFQDAHLNYIGTGAEGGISAYVDFYGTLANGDPVNIWYSVDWTQINEQLAVSNATIAGSNRQPPLYYNQAGIDYLQRVAAQKLSNGVSYGLILGSVILTKLPQAEFIANVNAGKYSGNAVINAEPFNVYTQENPSDYAMRQYNGLTAVYTPQLGFKHIVFNLNVNLFV